MQGKYVYGVASTSRLLEIKSLFCRISSLLYGSFAKETYNLREPTNRSHSILESRCGCRCQFEGEQFGLFSRLNESCLAQICHVTCQWIVSQGNGAYQIWMSRVDSDGSEKNTVVFFCCGSHGQERGWREIEWSVRFWFKKRSLFLMKRVVRRTEVV